MTEVGPSGVKGSVQVKEATEEEIKDKTILETIKYEDAEKTFKSDLQIESGIAKSVTTNQQENERFNKILKIEACVQEALKEQYGESYKSSVRVSNGDRQVILDGLIYSKKGKIKSAVEIKYISSKRFESIRFIIARKLRQLYTFGIKRLTIFLVSDSFTEEEILDVYNQNLHQAQIYFFTWDGVSTKELKIPNRKNPIV